MDVKALSYYVAIADQKSINKAAEILYISQPVLSRTVQALEDELGVQLLIRTNHGIEMTPVGQSLYYYAHSILSQFDEIERLKKTYHAVVETRLLVSTAMLLLQDAIVQDYFKAASSDHAVINIQETGIEQAIKNVSDQISEIAIMTLNSVQHRVMTRVIKIQGLQMHSIKKDAVYVHLAQTHPLAQRSTITTTELLDMTYLRMPQDFYTQLNYTFKVGDQELTNFKKTVTINNYHTMINLLKHSVSFSLA
jgi:DNA-binding transcriptional LysR family regulator